MLDAGAFSTWLAEVQQAIRGERDSDVPCGTCTGCCTSSQFVHIGPDETDALAHIPHDLLFRAPRMPMGHVLMGYDERGHCPMLIDGRCTIYAHRPRTCRTYDCRVFPAAGLEVDDDAKAAIAERVARWRFTHPTPRDRVEHDAVLASAAFLVDPARAADLPPGAVPASSTPLAVLAVELHAMFVSADDAGAPAHVVEPDVAAVRVELGRRAAARQRR